MDSSKRFSAILMLLVVCLLVGILPSVSALDLQSVSLEKVGVDWDNVDSFTKTKDTSVYGKYEIRNSVLGIPFLQLSKVADIELKTNSDSCGIDCFAEKEITLYNDGILIDDIIFKTEQEDGSWIEQDIRNFQFSYQGEIQDYKTVCVADKELSLNGTQTQTCEQVTDGTHIGTINYNEGEVVSAGTYLLRLDGQKKPSRTVDWIVKSNGIFTNEWAVWGNISLGDEAEVILNSPSDLFEDLDGNITFNATANVTGGATLTNMTLYNNISGSWIANGTNILNGATLNDSTEYSENHVSGTWLLHEYTIGDKYLKNSSHIIYRTGSGLAYDAKILYTYTDETTEYTSITEYPDSLSEQVLEKDNPHPERNVDTIGLYMITGTQQTMRCKDALAYELPITSTQTFTETITGPTLWNVKACDSDGDCGFAPSNFTVFLDDEAPSINITAPINTLDYNYIGGNETLNVTFTDTNLESCWYNYNGTNVTIPGCLTTVLNSTNFLLESSNTNLTVYANDSLGNMNSSFIEWDYKLLVYDETYSSDTYDTTVEDFILNFTYDNIEYPSVTANLVYNGTNYTGAMTASGDNGSASSSVNIPSVSEGTNITFYWEIFLNDGDNITAIETATHTQTINPLDDIIISDSACGAGEFTSVYYNFKNSENLTAINIDVNYNFKFGISELETKVVNGALNNISSLYICINESVDSYKLGYGEVEYSVTGYSDRRYYMYEGQSLSNSTQANHTLYSLPSASSTSFIFEFKNTYLNPYTEKLVALLRWYPEEDEYKVVEMAKTDDTGKTVMKVHTEDVDYRVGLYYLNGSLIKLADPVRMACLVDPCTYTLKVIHDPIDFDVIYNIESSLTWDEDNNRFVYVFNDPAQLTSQMRLHVYKDAGFQEILICNDTATGYTGVLTCDVGNYTGSLVAKVYRAASPEWAISSLYHSIRDNIESSFGLFASFLIVLLSALVGIFSPISAVVFMLLGLIPAVMFGSMTFAVAMGIGVLGGIIINIIKNYS